MAASPLTTAVLLTLAVALPLASVASLVATVGYAQRSDPKWHATRVTFFGLLLFGTIAGTLVAWFYGKLELHWFPDAWIALPIIIWGVVIVIVLCTMVEEVREFVEGLLD